MAALTLLIRPAQPSDAPSIAWVHIVSWRAAYASLLSESFLASLSLKDRTERWQRTITGDLSRTHVALVDDVLVGFIRIGPATEVPEEIAGRKPGFIYTFYIHPEFWRRSIGTELLREASSEMVDDFDELFLLVFADNHLGKRFYESRGFSFRDVVVKKEVEPGRLHREELWGKRVGSF